MICPRCRSETRVVSSRPHVDDAAVTVRRRACAACPHRFETFESTINAARIRANRAREKARQRAVTPPELRRARIKRDNLLRAARKEAAATGRPLPEILRAWDLGSSPLP